LDHLLSLLEERDHRYQDRFEAQERSLATASEALGARLSILNEFRVTVNDVIANNPTRAELESVRKEMSALSARMDRSEGRGSGLDMGWKILIGAIAAIATLVALWSGFNAP
jgi:hypothetical protein